MLNSFHQLYAFFNESKAKNKKNLNFSYFYALLDPKSFYLLNFPKQPNFVLKKTSHKNISSQRPCNSFFSIFEGAESEIKTRPHRVYIYATYLQRFQIMFASLQLLFAFFPEIKANNAKK